MGFDAEKDAQQKAETRRQILEAAFRIFAERTIDKVTMTDVAEAAGVGVASVYRYYGSKNALVVAVSTHAWTQYMKESDTRFHPEGMTGAGELGYFLDAFLDLYRNHRDLLRFNQFFNAYVQSEAITSEQMAPYMEMIAVLTDVFHMIYEKGREDGTLRTRDTTEREMFSAIVHLMLAAVTRYAVGLVFTEGVDPEQELLLARDLLLARYTA